jgi:hypothetical protein
MGVARPWVPGGLAVFVFRGLALGDLALVALAYRRWLGSGAVPISLDPVFHMTQE